MLLQAFRIREDREGRVDEKDRTSVPHLISPPRIYIKSSETGITAVLLVFQLFPHNFHRHLI